MHFVVFATDKPGMDSVRAENRPSHRQYLRHHEHPVKVLLGGPTFKNTGERMNGTMLVVEADTLKQVRNFMEADPYCRAGLFESLEVRPWVCGLGRPGG